jgi:hypothetical protein
MHPAPAHTVARHGNVVETECSCRVRLGRTDTGTVPGVSVPGDAATTAGRRRTNRRAGRAPGSERSGPSFLCQCQCPPASEPQIEIARHQPNAVAAGRRGALRASLVVSPIPSPFICFGKKKKKIISKSSSYLFLMFPRLENHRH